MPFPTPASTGWAARCPAPLPHSPFPGSPPSLPAVLRRPAARDRPPPAAGWMPPRLPGRRARPRFPPPPRARRLAAPAGPSPDTKSSRARARGASPEPPDQRRGAQGDERPPRRPLRCAIGGRRERRAARARHEPPRLERERPLVDLVERRENERQGEGAERAEALPETD